MDSRVSPEELAKEWSLSFTDIEFVTRPGPKWAAPILKQPTSQNHCETVQGSGVADGVGQRALRQEAGLIVAQPPLPTKY